MEHIEEAGIHSGDSASVIPPFSLSREIVEEIIQKTKQIAKELGVVGLMNVQYAIQKDQVYCLEVNPRASRTVPFVSKTIGVPLAKLAAQLMVGKTLKELRFTEEIVPKHVAVKESVFPFVKFPGVDIILSPEMKSTGEVMGIDKDFGKAFYKSQDAAMSHIPRKGTVFISVKETDKPKIAEIARELYKLGLKIVSTKGTGKVLRDAGVPAEEVLKMVEGSPNLSHWIKEKKMDLIINTPSGKGPMLDEGKIRSLAVAFNIPCITTLSAARAAVRGLQAVRDDDLDVKSIQDYHGIKAKS